MNTLDSFLAGATIVAAWVIATFFWRFHHRTKQRLFACFALAFLLLGLERLCLSFISSNPHSAIYLIRLVAFLLILYGIADRNRRGRRERQKQAHSETEQVH